MKGISIPYSRSNPFGDFNAARISIFCCQFFFFKIIAQNFARIHYIQCVVYTDRVATQITFIFPAKLRTLLLLLLLWRTRTTQGLWRIVECELHKATILWRFPLLSSSLMEKGG